MCDTQTLRCRLCAAAKPISHLVNLQTDENIRRKTLQKLSRFCIVVANLDSINDEVAKTVCILCMSSLDNAFDFVMKVEAAQSNLHEHHDVKRETDVVISYGSTNKAKGHIKKPPACSTENDLDIFRDSNGYENEFTLNPNITVKIEENLITSQQPYRISLQEIIDANINIKYNNIDLLDETQSQLKIKDANDDIKYNNTDLLDTQSQFKIKDANIDIQYNNIDLLDETQSQLSSWKDYSWMCAYCNTLFPHFDEMKKHSMQYHGCCNVYQCIDCKSKKFQLDTFLRHVYTHRKHLSLSCYKCHVTFSHVKILQCHKKIHMNSTNKCYGCNETFDSLDELTKHRKTYRKGYKNTFPPELQQLADNLTCIKCQKTFTNKDTLKKHLLTHEDRPRDYTCDKCGKRFLNKTQMVEHTIVHEDLKAHQCKICKKSYGTLNRLRKHIGIHNDHKPFACDECGKRFRLQRYLNNHVSVHTDSRPWICDTCHKSFRLKTTLKNHKRQHTGEQPYSCKICERAFTNKGNYHKHLKLHGQDT